MKYMSTYLYSLIKGNKRKYAYNIITVPKIIIYDSLPIVSHYEKIIIYDSLPIVICVYLEADSYKLNK